MRSLKEVKNKYKGLILEKYTIYYTNMWELNSYITYNSLTTTVESNEVVIKIEIYIPKHLFLFYNAKLQIHSMGDSIEELYFSIFNFSKLGKKITKLFKNIKLNGDKGKANKLNKKLNDFFESKVFNLIKN